ncbi:MAG: hypothetical protein C0483_23720 [Pirellula sp.]|nr:hypothetical protein [Pirellula sp.]
MPKKLINKLIRCVHFTWRMYRRGETWYADGRSNAIRLGRHSLDTSDREEALQRLTLLDERCAVKHGLIEGPCRPVEPHVRLKLEEGRALYEQHISRPRVLGGVAPATKKRYRTTFNGFVPWAVKEGLNYFDQVNKHVLNRFAAHLESRGRTSKTIMNELTTLVQCVRWLIEEGSLPNGEPITLKLRKFESQRSYCYIPQEVAAMVAHCRADARLGWLGDVVVGLACSGMRIAELTGLKWSDVDLGNGWITLTDETGYEAGVEPRRTLKSGRSRSVPIDAELRSVLERLPRKASQVFLGPTQRALKPDFVRRKFVRHVIKPLAPKFPGTPGKQSFVNGRLHSFRHAFVSRCAAQNVAVLVVMEWVGHAESPMVRHYFHLHDEESRRQMRGLDFLGGAGGRSDGEVSVS